MHANIAVPFLGRHRRFIVSSLLLSLLGSFALHAQDLQTLKLFGRWTQPPTNYYLGGAYTSTALAVSDKWIVAGSSFAKEQGIYQSGSVQVFNAATGAWVRKLLPPSTPSGGLFGICCSISGNTAVIGNGETKVFAFDLTTGKKLFEIPQPGGLDTDLFGLSLAVSNFGILVGASGEYADRGAVYLFSNKGSFLGRLQPPDTVAGDFFGHAIAIDGDLAVISAFKGNGGAGAVYLYDLRTASLIKKFTPTGAVAGDEAGRTLAFARGKAFLGAPNADSTKGKVFQIDVFDGTQKILLASDGTPGADAFGQALATDGGLLLVGSNVRKAYVFDIASPSTTELRIIHQPDLANNSSGFGISVGIANGTAVVAASSDNTQATKAGALYLFRTITRPTAMAKVAARGDFAPGTVETTFKTLSDACINPVAEVVFTSSLTGFGSNKGKDSGFWSTMAANNPLNLILKSRDLLTGSPVALVSKAISNHPNMAIFSATISGNGVNAYNREVLMKTDGITTDVLLQAGNTNNPQGARIQNFLNTVQSSYQDRVATSVRFRVDRLALASEDTGIIVIKPSVSTRTVPVAEGLREGSAAGATGLTYGQFTGRVALADSEYANASIFYTAAVAGPTATNQALFFKLYGMAEVLVAQRGGPPAAGAGGASFSTFLGETAINSPECVFRATLGPPAIKSNNEGIWRTRAGNAASETLVFRKGESLAALNGLKIAKIINFWGGSEARRNVIALVKLSGPGVTAANDMALLLNHATPPAGSVINTMVLMREGDPARGCFPATIGTISRVEVRPEYGQYLVLATLAGAPSTTNQCLFGGNAGKLLASAVEETLLRPLPVLRKGELYSNQPSKLKSISLPTGNITASGAGGTGMGSSIQKIFSGRGRIVVTLEFDNKLRQIMKGLP